MLKSTLLSITPWQTRMFIFSGMFVASFNIWDLGHLTADLKYEGDIEQEHRVLSVGGADGAALILYLIRDVCRSAGRLVLRHYAQASHIPGVQSAASSNSILSMIAARIDGLYLHSCCMIHARRNKMTTYSISLDDVDLALLPLRTHKYNDFLKKEYFEFQVLKTDIAEDINPTVLYICHICDIEVPAAFAREHATSIKHQANARIASVAAERTRAYIAAPPPPAAAQPFARFCANCAAIVDEEHEKTKEHRVAVMHDRLLWDLMQAYVKEDYDKFKYDDFDDQMNGIENTYKVNKCENDDTEYIDVSGDDNYKDRKVAQNINNNNLMTLIDNHSERDKKIENISVNIHKKPPLHIVRKDTSTSKTDKTQDVTTAKNNNVKQLGDTKNDKNTTNGSIPAIQLKDKGKSLVSKQTSNIVGSVNEYQYEVLANGHLWCAVCKCAVPDGARNKKQHITGLKHQQAQSKARAVADTHAASGDV